MTTGSNRFSMLHALWCMRRKCKKQDRYSTKITAGVYARLKVERSKILSISMTGEGNHMFGKTGKLAPCYGRTGDKHPLFGIAPTPESNKKRSEKLSGVPKSEESNKKRSKSHKGKPHDYQRGENNQCFTQLKNGNHPSQIKKTCVHCGKTVSINAFAKWHDANCIVVKQRVPSIKKKCPHCDTLAAASQYTRYHGDKCKKNITYTDL